MEETFTYVSVKEEKRALDVFNEERMLWDLKIYTFDIWWVNGSHLFFCAKLQPLIYFFIMFCLNVTYKNQKRWIFSQVE